jgi:hypothetical protein
MMTSENIATTGNESSTNGNGSANKTKNKEKLHKSLSMGNLDCEDEENLDVLPVSQARVAFETRPNGRKSADIFVVNSNSQNISGDKIENKNNEESKITNNNEDKISKSETTTMEKMEQNVDEILESSTEKTNIKVTKKIS